KLAGSTQVNELGELESPIVLTCTLCVPRAADAVLTYLLGLPGNADVRSANPVVAETNDGFLNDIRARAITAEDVLGAIRSAAPGRRGAACCAPTPHSRWLGHYRRGDRRAAGSPAARAAGPPRPRRPGPDGEQHEQRVGRLCDRVFDRAGSGAGRAADRHGGGR